MDDCHIAQGGNASRLPVEICENVIDMLYSADWVDQVRHTRALRSCALVCRALRIRSQRNLFYSVELHNMQEMHKFSAILGNGPHLCDYVREVVLIGHTLHTATGLLSFFPLALHGRLPRLRTFDVGHGKEDSVGPIRTPELGSTNAIVDHLPLHPRFPLFLSAFTTITSLTVHNVTFRHFNDFLAMVHALPSLRNLICQKVHCKVLGPLPMCTKPLPDVRHSCGRPFASDLQELELVCTMKCVCYACDIAYSVQSGHALCSGMADNMWAPTQQIGCQHALHFGRWDGDL